MSFAGDPIEVGAATTILKGAACPLHMTAAKSRVGHAEPAAGTIGLLQVRSSDIAKFAGSIPMHTIAAAINILPCSVSKSSAA